MKPIVTLTLNPSIDGACETDKVRPTHKVRTTNERYDPGGGGINVARVLGELGAATVPVYLAGGATGGVLDELLVRRGFQVRQVPIADQTRISHAVYERSTGLEYRFVPEGPCVTGEEWQRAIAAVESLDFDYCVASGSLPRGVPDDFYVELGRLIARKGARFVLDTSGPALRKALAAGGIYLAKPSLGEFEALAGRSLRDPDALAQAALALVHKGAVELLAVTMGHEGALLTSRAGVKRIRPPDVTVKSAVGAGDSFVGAMTYGLAGGRAEEDAFVLGVAAGTAAVLTPGTELCRKADVWRLYDALMSPAAESVS